MRIIILALVISFNTIYLLAQSPSFNQKASLAETYQHFILYGQSLSTGNQSYPSLSVTNIAGNYMIGDQVWINYGNTNFSNFTPLIATLAKSDVSKPLSRNGGMAECPLIAAVNHIQTNSDVKNKILASSAGTGGRSIEQLSKESKQSIVHYLDYTKTITKASEIAKNKGYSITCPAIIWMQGENNYIANNDRGLIPGQPNCTDKIRYKRLLIQLKNNMQTDVMTSYSQTEKPFFITYQTGVQYTKGKSLEIGMAQLEMANENEDVFCAGPVYQMSDRGGHLDANGYGWYGEMIAKAYLKTINSGKKFQPLQPIEVARASNPKEVIVKFLVPTLPLVLDTLTVKKVTDFGFTVYNDDVRQTINSVTIDNDCVRVICSADLNGKVEVVYAGLNTTSPNDNGHGNLRDSDNYQSIYNYINLDKKNADNSYFFPREATETTLHPIYEPKDEQGEIYDKPYPLYNFSVAFYYSIGRTVENYVVPNLSSLTDVKTTKSVNQIYFSGSTLFLNNDIDETAFIEIYNSKGQLVTKSKTREAKFSTANLLQGNYIVKISINNVKSVLKISV